MRTLHALEKHPNRRGKAKTDVIGGLLSIFLKRKVIFWPVLGKRSVY